MDTTNKLAQNTLQHMAPIVGSQVIDVATALMIVQIINLLANSCLALRNKPDKLNKSIKNPSIIQRWVLRNYIKQVVNHTAYKNQTKLIMESLLKAASNLTIDEIESIFEENQK